MELRNLLIRILPSGDEVEVSIPIEAMGRDLIQALVEAEELNVPKTDASGNVILYKILAKSSGQYFEEFQTILDAGILDGETLLLTPQFIAG